MGRGRGGKRQRLFKRDFGKPDTGAEAWKRSEPRSDGGFMEPADLANEAFEEYYRQQGVLPVGEEDAFFEALRRPLPITFRINGSGRFANELREKLQTDFFSHFSSGPITLDGEALDPPRPLPWYPDNLAWHLSFSRNQLRKLSWLSDIHEFMKSANEHGSITRQEAVSMVPPLLLDVQPHHKVLDVCAAPGSKTFQLLEMLHAAAPQSQSPEGGNGTSNSSGGDVAPAGFVIANDSDAQRCNLLVHQTKRMCSPCLMVTNHNGQDFPRIADASGTAMEFDRILCDVPCSGDGTMRKAPDIWRRWTVNNGNGLHSLQLRIVMHAARLLKVGGRLVYSTCTFNPVEDEAVVAELLLRAGGSLKLLDVSDRLPELVRVPGVRRWRVRDKHQWYNSWQEAEKVGFKLDPSMFCTPEKEALPLERCMRILPHHQDTGGFFVAVLEKVAPTPNMVEPGMAHRYTRFLSIGRDGRLIKVDGVDPFAGAAAAAEYAVQAAERAVSALEAGDAAAVESAAAGAAAALSQAGMAFDAHQDILKNERRYNAQEDRHRAAQQAKLAQQQQANGQANGPAATDGGAAALQQDMEVDGAVVAADATTTGDLIDVGDDKADDGKNGEPMQEQQGSHPTQPSQRVGDDNPGVTLPSEGSDPPAADAAAAAADNQAQAKAAPSWVRGGGSRNRGGGGGRFQGVDPILPVEDPAVLELLVKFYGVEPSFPLATQLITRSTEASLPKRLYYVSDSLLALLLADTREALKITATGLKLFERHEMRANNASSDAPTSGNACPYRIAQEGLPFLLPHLTRQVLRLGAADLLRLVTEKNLPLPLPAQAAAQVAAAATAQQPEAGGAVEQQQKQQQDAAASGAADAGACKPKAGSGRSNSGQVLLHDPHVLQQLRDIQTGGAVALLREEDAAALGLATTVDGGALSANAPLAASVWVTRASLCVLVSKSECEQMADKLRSAISRAAATTKGANGAPAAASKA